jgi:hypothetical protein
VGDEVGDEGLMVRRGETGDEGIDVAGHDRTAEGEDAGDDRAGLGAAADEVAQADEPVGACGSEVGQDRRERDRVGVDVRDECDVHPVPWPFPHVRACRFRRRCRTGTHYRWRREVHRLAVVPFRIAVLHGDEDRIVDRGWAGPTGPGGSFVND